MKSTNYGPLLILSTTILYAIAHTLVKILATSIPITQLAFTRFLAGPILLIPLILAGTFKPKITSWPLMATRTIAGVIGMLGLFLAFKIGDPGKVTLIFQSGAIWTYILGRIILKETPSIQTKLMVPVAFIGLYIVIEPNNFTTIAPADIIAFISSIINAIVFLSLKELRKNNDSLSIMMINYTLSTLILAPFTLSHFVIPTLNQTGLLILVGIFGFLGNLIMTIGFKHTSATVASNLLLLLVPLMALSGGLFFGETFTNTDIFGSIIVLLSLIIISKYQ